MKTTLILIAIASLLLISACQIVEPKADPTQFFVLDVAKPADGAMDKASSIDRKIEVMPVRIPKYLDRPHIVGRDGDNQIHYSDFERWAEPLDDGISRVLINELEGALGNGTAYHFPYHGTRDKSKIIKLRLEVLAFEIVDNKHARLQSRWEISASNDTKVIASGHGTIQLPITAASTKEQVETLSQTLRKLAQSIAGALEG